MKWRWSEEEVRAEWPKWKAQGKAAYLWRHGVLKMGVTYGAGMLIFEIFFLTLQEGTIPFAGYLGIVVVTILIAVLFGLSVGLIVWRQMMKKYG